jgi:hypothetical protein
MGGENRPNGAGWADVALALVHFAETDPTRFVLLVLLPLGVAGCFLYWAVGVLGVRSIRKLMNAYAERLKKGAPTVTDDRKGESQ